MKKICPIILCGGFGTRLWPLSRKNYPKQFIKLNHNLSFFQQTIKRFLLLENEQINIDELIIITNEEHRFIVYDEIISLKLKLNFKIFLEPESRNTAPALSVASSYISRNKQDSLMIVAPSDHFIQDDFNFIKSMHQSIYLSSDSNIITIGIKPSSNATGYGYIKLCDSDSQIKVDNFIEKPTYEKAKEMVSSGLYLWNSGIFIMKSQTWLAAIKKADNQIYKFATMALENSKIDNKFIRLDSEQFVKCKSDSIDYSVMEKFASLNIEVLVVKMDAGWSDAGNFENLADFFDNDKFGNSIYGDVNTFNSRNNIAYSSSRNISLLGVNDLIVIETKDCILVANKKDSQSIKNLVNEILKTNSNIVNCFSRTFRPWGWFEVLYEENSYKVKLIQVNPFSSISLQKHKKRSEHWVVVSGEAKVTKGKNTIFLKKDESTYITVNELHRIENHKKIPLKIIEIQSGNYLGEDDIVRFEDNYGRS